MSFLVRDILFSASAHGESVILGKDDLTGNYVALRTEKKHPFVAWSKDEIANFRTHLYNRDKMYDGARYGWNHQQIGPLAKAKRGDPLSAAQVWQVTADRVMADTAGEYLLKKARHFNDEAFIGAGHWAAASDLKQSALVYDLIADSEVLSSDEDKEIRAYLSRALHMLRSLKPYYGSINNMGVHIDASAWAAALCIEDVDMLKELFQRLKKLIGQGILPHGYWYEGTAYGNMVRDWMSDLAEYGGRSGIDLAHLHVKRTVLSPKWTFAGSYAQMGELFTWPFRVITPFMDIPNIGDGPKPSKLETYKALRLGKYTDEAELTYRLYTRDLKLHRHSDPHKWGDFPPDPDVVPLDNLGDMLYPDLGLFIFRQGTGLTPDDQYVILYSLPRTGFHMHSDQGHISIAKYGRWLTGEIESSAKSTGYQELRSTFSAARWAHNTVVVGGQWGKSEIDFPRVNYQSVQPANLKIADISISDFTDGPQTTQRRRVLVTDNFIAVVDDLISSERTTFDWFFHGVNNARWFFEKTFDKSTEPFITYIPRHSKPDQKLTWEEAYVTNKPWQGRFVVDENENIGLKVWHLDVAGGKASSGSLAPPKHGGTGLYDAEKMNLVCQRKEGTEAHFVAILEPFKGESNIESVALEKNSPDNRIIRIVFKNKVVQLLSIGEGKYSLQQI